MSSSEDPRVIPRVLLAKPGMDGHNRGVNVIRRALIDAGCEVVYLGIRRQPQEIAAAAIQEDVDIVGLSVLSGAHIELTTDVIDSLKAVGAPDIKVMVGGIIPDEDQPTLLELGVSHVFTPGTTLDEIESSVFSLVAQRRGETASSEELT